MGFKNVLKTLFKNRKSIIFIWLVVVLAFWLGSRIPHILKQIKINNHVWLVNTLKQDRADKETSWRVSQRKIEEELKTQHDLHNQADEVREEINLTCYVLCSLDPIYCEKEWLCWVKEVIKKEEPKDIIRTYQNIVLHHTETDYVSISDMKNSMLNHVYTNGSWFIPCHYIIDEYGQFEKVKPLYEVAWWMSVANNNMSSIQIEVIGRLNEKDLTQDQKKTIKYLISEIEKKFWPQNIMWHQEMEWEQTGCPWKYGMKFIEELRNPVFQ